MTDRNTPEILRRVQDMVATCVRGLDDLLGPDPTLSMIGLRNVAVFGRSVTFVLQTLRSTEGDRFDRWYEPRRAEMKDDPLMAFFVQVRNEILKEGGPVVGTSVYIEHLDMQDLALLRKNPPPGATRFFIGDRLGGSGWEVELPDGTAAKYYVQLPESVRATIDLVFHDPPTEHGGKPIRDKSVGGLARLYIQALASLVDDALREFGDGEDSS